MVMSLLHICYHISSNVIIKCKLLSLVFLAFPILQPDRQIKTHLAREISPRRRDQKVSVSDNVQQFALSFKYLILGRSSEQYCKVYQVQEKGQICQVWVRSYLIFVTSITYIQVEKKMVMWRNFRFQYTTDVEKCESLPNLEEFHISPHDRCEEI